MEAQSSFFSVILYDEKTKEAARFGRVCSLQGKCKNDVGRELYPKRILFSSPLWSGLIILNSVLIGNTELLTGELTDGVVFTSWRELTGIPALHIGEHLKVLGSFSGYTPPGYVFDASLPLILTLECE